MSHQAFSWELFNKLPIVGIIRNLSLAEVNFVLPIYKQAGFSTIEITMNTPDALEIIEAVVTQYNGVFNVGAGTVCTMNDLQDALRVGANFIVTPIFNPEVVKKCVSLHVPIFPGAFSPTEIYEASELGASMVKLYPASVVGPAYVSAVLAPLNKIKLMPTGGINLSNMQAFIQAGATSLGIGSELFDKKIIQKRDSIALLNHFKLFAQQIQLSK
ncbi:MAG: bifunctional 4-hydroxy-2-oxoglutarate aldolase/2-dehydro-3-deoxy-phosphogluconate aldolase [Sediminibacterium sp.]|jgi:2-dehydro-3-deoxyphosphogluconate aldolase/(4S)-4-hydroxy-2-oxoglutarate aldolase